MSQSGSERTKKANSLLDALVEDAMSHTMDEIREEITESGGDPERIATEMRLMTTELVLLSRKSLLEQANAKWRQHAGTPNLAVRSPSRIRERLRALVSANEAFANGRVAIAFRNGVSQSDNDLLSLWQDLIDLGAVSDDELRD